MRNDIMRNIILIAAAASFLVSIVTVFALDGIYYFAYINYGRGWWPFTCLVDYNEKPTNFSREVANSVTCSKAQQCPFGANAFGRGAGI